MEASKKDSTKAMYYIGFYYFNGYGVQKNISKAKVWMKKAEAKGHKRATNFLKINNL